MNPEAFFGERLTEILLPNGGIVAVLEAYFDASTQRVFSVCGYAFEVPQAKKLSKEWRRLFARYGGNAHMTDLHARKRQFNGISDAEVNRLMQEQVKLINRRISF
jgi:DNA-binding GntR family transcriptional regulator